MAPKPTMDIPRKSPGVRRKRGDQVEKAGLAFMDSASKSMAAMPGPLTDIAKQALAITEANLKASCDQARKLLQANDVSEVMQLQSEFLRKQFGAATEQLLQLTDGMSSNGKKTTLIRRALAKNTRRSSITLRKKIV